MKFLSLLSFLLQKNILQLTFCRRTFFNWLRIFNFFSRTIRGKDSLILIAGCAYTQPGHGKKNTLLLYSLPDLSLLQGNYNSSLSCLLWLFMLIFKLLFIFINVITLTNIIICVCFSLLSFCLHYHFYFRFTCSIFILSSCLNLILHFLTHYKQNR